jgi:hypothetical protein
VKPVGTADARSKGKTLKLLYYDHLRRLDDAWRESSRPRRNRARPEDGSIPASPVCNASGEHNPLGDARGETSLVLEPREGEVRVDHASPIITTARGISMPIKPRGPNIISMSLRLRTNHCFRRQLLRFYAD